jgi:hypothetical protein
VGRLEPAYVRPPPQWRQRIVSCVTWITAKPVIVRLDVGTLAEWQLKYQHRNVESKLFRMHARI